MDLSFLKPTKDAVPLHLKNPVTKELLYDTGEDGKPDETKPVRILIYGMDSEPYKVRQRHILDRRLEQAVENRGKVRLKAETVEEENLRTLVACIAGWENLQISPEPFPFNTSNARKLIEEFSWIEEQVDEGIVDRANFIKAS